MRQAAMIVPSIQPSQARWRAAARGFKVWLQTSRTASAITVIKYSSKEAIIEASPSRIPRYNFPSLNALSTAANPAETAREGLALELWMDTERRIKSLLRAHAFPLAYPVSPAELTIPRRWPEGGVDSQRVCRGVLGSMTRDRERQREKERELFSSFSFARLSPSSSFVHENDNIA